MDLKPNTLYDISSQEEIPNDLKAVSTNLSPELVLQAYPMGLFPWHQDDKFFYWFSTIQIKGNVYRFFSYAFFY